MKKIVLKIGFEEEKLKAIKVSLKEKNKDFEQEIVKFLDGLYSKNVPKVLKKYIENSIEIEQKSEEKIEQKLEGHSNIELVQEKKTLANVGTIY